MRAIQIEEFGGPEVLTVAEVPKPDAPDGCVLVEVSRGGINFTDTHARESSYLAKYELPMIVGTTFPLSEVARAHEDMQARSTSGKQLLDPRA